MIGKWPPRTTCTTLRMFMTLFFHADYLGRKSPCLFDVGCRESTMPMPLKFLVDGARFYSNIVFELFEYSVHCFVSLS